MKSYLIGHLNDYNNVQNTFNAGDWIATSGNTGLSTGPHSHFSASTSGDKLANHFRGNPGLCDPSDLPIDTTGVRITLGYQSTEAPYSVSKPHTGIDYGFNYAKLILTKGVTVTDKGTHNDFGNFIVFVVNGEDNNSGGNLSSGSFQVVRSGSDVGTYSFNNEYRNRFIPQGSKYILNQSTPDSTGTPWGATTLFDSIIEGNVPTPPSTSSKHPNVGNFRAVRPDGEVARFRDEYAPRLVLQPNGMYKLNQDTPQCDTNNNNLPSSENWLAGSIFHYTINDEA